MEYRIRASVAITGLMALTALTTGASTPISTQAYPPPGYFRLPTAIAGAPTYEGGEGEPCGPENGNCTVTERIIPHVTCDGGSSCRVDMYGVTPNVPMGKGATSYSFYQVEVYASATQATGANRLRRDTLDRRDDANRIVPLLPLVRPVGADEWMRGRGDTAVCYAVGGLHDGDMVLYVHALIQSLSPHSHRCAATNTWATRVLAALRTRATAWAGSRVGHNLSLSSSGRRPQRGRAAEGQDVRRHHHSPLIDLWGTLVLSGSLMSHFCPLS